MLVEHFCGKEVTCMPDMERVEKLTSILEERSGLDVREALVRFYLLDTLGVEIELPF